MRVPGPRFKPASAEGCGGLSHFRIAIAITGEIHGTTFQAILDAQEHGVKSAGCRSFMKKWPGASRTSPGGGLDDPLLHG